MLAKPPEWAGECPLCRAHTSVYNLRDASGSFLAETDVKSLYGCVFVQGGTLGFASYHFDAPDDCYLSYESAPSAWRLEDGSAPPAKKPWTEISYDPDTLTFRGVVEWSPAFAGMDRWDYKIIFAEDFAGVVGGEVIMRFLDGTTKKHPFRAPWELGFDRALAYLRWTPPPTTIFGSVYVQGTMYAPILEGIASYHFDSEDYCYISYSNAPSDWLLDDGSTLPKKKEFCNPSFDSSARTFRGSVEWETPFGGDSRWDYEIVFANDFSLIASGQINAFGSDGTPREVTSFINPADMHALLTRDGMTYVLKPTVLTSRSKTVERITDVHESD